MAAGNVANCISHRQHCQSKRERHAKQANTHFRKRSRQHCTATTTEHQPECSNELRAILVHAYLLLIVRGCLISMLRCEDKLTRFAYYKRQSRESLSMCRWWCCPCR